MSDLQDLLAAAVELERRHTAELTALRTRLDQLEAAPTMYTVAEFARVTGTSERTIERAIEDDRIRVVVLGERTRVIPATELTGKFASEHRRGRPVAELRRAS